MMSLRKLLNQRTTVLVLVLVVLSTAMALLHTSKADALPGGPYCCSTMTITNYYSDASMTVWVGQCVNYYECVGTNSCAGNRTSYFITTSHCCTNCKS
jgi:hypothetical protein